MKSALWASILSVDRTNVIGAQKALSTMSYCYSCDLIVSQSNVSSQIAPECPVQQIADVATNQAISTAVSTAGAAVVVAVGVSQGAAIVASSAMGSAGGSMSAAGSGASSTSNGAQGSSMWKIVKFYQSIVVVGFINIDFPAGLRAHFEGFAWMLGVFRWI